LPWSDFRWMLLSNPNVYERVWERVFSANRWIAMNHWDVRVRIISVTVLNFVIILKSRLRPQGVPLMFIVSAVLASKLFLRIFFSKIHVLLSSTLHALSFRLYVFNVPVRISWKSRGRRKTEQTLFGSTQRYSAGFRSSRASRMYRRRGRIVFQNYCQVFCSSCARSYKYESAGKRATKSLRF